MRQRLFYQDAFMRARQRTYDTPYGKNIQRLSDKIFGDALPPVDKSAAKYIVLNFARKPFWSDEEMIRYYAPQPALHFLTKVMRAYGLYRDEHDDFSEEGLRSLRARGKGGPMKIGEGKRALLRKQQGR